MSNSKDPRWSKQFGDFGEQLVMYLVGRHKNMKVACVDHAGADLIASDLGNENNRYAISVKSKTLNIKTDEDKIEVESKLYNFDKHNITELENFSKNFKLKPVVSIVIVQPEILQTHPEWQKRLKRNNNRYFEKHDKLVIDVFTFLLNDAFRMIEEGKRYCTEQNKSPWGFNFKFENLYFEEMLADKRIDHTRLSFDALDYERRWDTSNPMDIHAEDILPWGSGGE